MDFLLADVVSRIPKGYDLTCLYVVDNHLRYVLIHNKNTFYLHYVDGSRLGECINSSESYVDFDFHVIKLNQPIITQRSRFDNLNGHNVRIVETMTVSGNPLTKKPKSSNEQKVITRYIANKKKLF